VEQKAALGAGGQGRQSALFLSLLWLVNLLQMLLGGQQVGGQRVRAAGKHAASARRVGGWPGHTPAVHAVG
jgi:hypothetical protein